MKTVVLYGHLRAKFGRSFNYDIRSPSEAIRALKATVPGFGDYVIANSAPGYRVLVGTQVVPKLDDLAIITGESVIKIVPVVAGAADKGAFGIILGIALIVAAPYLAPIALAGSVTMGSIAMSLGVSMILGGVSSLLAGGPKESGASAAKPSNQPSFVFNGAVNTTQQGNPVAILYGELVTGSQVASAGLSAESLMNGDLGTDAPQNERLEVRETYIMEPPSVYTVTDAAHYVGDAGVVWFKPAPSEDGGPDVEMAFVRVENFDGSNDYQYKVDETTGTYTFRDGYVAYGLTVRVAYYTEAGV